MKGKKIWILLIVCLVLSVSVVFIIISKPSKDLSTDDKNIIGELDITKTSYGYPLIYLLSYNAGVLSIDAGIYRFGDIDQDGIVGSSDIDALKIMIEAGKVGFTDGQIKLADVNEDGSINNGDIKLFEQYLKKNGNVKYSVNSNLLLYCITTVNDNNTCSWQKKSTFNIVKGKNYYVFVKQSNNGRISDSMLFKKDATEELAM